MSVLEEWLEHASRLLRELSPSEADVAVGAQAFRHLTRKPATP